MDAEREERVELRPAAPSDRELLFGVYAAARADELAVVDWPQAAVDAFLRQQFDAQDQDYRQNYPGATFEVIVVGGHPAGRMYLHVTPDETRVMDIALLPGMRGHGVGTRLLGDVLAAAAARGACVTIHVERDNPALAWYQRLGFAVAEDRGVYLFLRWLPPVAAAGQELLTTPSFHAGSFEDHVGQVFLVSGGADGPPGQLELSLTSVTTSGPSTGEGQPQRFSIILHGPLEPALPQRIYRFEHPVMGSFDIFIVPLGPDEGAMRYQAVFA